MGAICADIESLKKGKTSQALCRSSLCLRRFSTSLTFFAHLYHPVVLVGSTYVQVYSYTWDILVYTLIVLGMHKYIGECTRYVPLYHYILWLRYLRSSMVYLVCIYVIMYVLSTCTYLAYWLLLLATFHSLPNLSSLRMYSTMHCIPHPSLILDDLFGVLIVRQCLLGNVSPPNLILSTILLHTPTSGTNTLLLGFFSSSAPGLGPRAGSKSHSSPTIRAPPSTAL